MKRLRPFVIALAALAALFGVVHSTQARATEPQDLFALDAKEGTLTPVAGKPGVFSLVLEGVRGRAIFFTDRPAREVGTVVVRRMLQNLFADDSPDPNAAINVAAAGRGRLMMGVELLGWHLDVRDRRLALRVRHLPQGGRTIGDVREDTILPRTFGDTSVFIDDCCSVTSTATVFNPGQLDLSLSINNGFPVVVPASSPETWLPGSKAIEFSAGGPQPGALGPGDNYVVILPSAGIAPITIPINLPGSIQFRSLQLYLFWSPSGVVWTVLNGGQLVGSGNVPTG